MKKLKKTIVLNFPSSLSYGEKEVEAILFAAAEPLDVDTIESKLPKKINVLSILTKLQNIYKALQKKTAIYTYAVLMDYNIS